MNTCQLCHWDHLNNHSTAYCSDCLKIVNNHPNAEFILRACDREVVDFEAAFDRVFPGARLRRVSSLSEKEE